MLQKLSNMRAAKERKRLANPVEREPKMKRWHRYEIGVRDRTTGECGWVELRSIRDAALRLGMILKFCP
jgi:hypothetical protein